jgi:hypothetical protein
MVAHLLVCGPLGSIWKGGERWVWAGNWAIRASWNCSLESGRVGPVVARGWLGGGCPVVSGVVSGVVSVYALGCDTPAPPQAAGGGRSEPVALGGDCLPVQEHAGCTQSGPGRLVPLRRTCRGGCPPERCRRFHWACRRTSCPRLRRTCRGRFNAHSAAVLCPCWSEPGSSDTVCFDISPQRGEVSPASGLARSAAGPASTRPITGAKRGRAESEAGGDAGPRAHGLVTDGGVGCPAAARSAGSGNALTACRSPVGGERFGGSPSQRGFGLFGRALCGRPGHRITPGPASARARLPTYLGGHGKAISFSGV